MKDADENEFDGGMPDFEIPEIDPIAKEAMETQIDEKIVAHLKTTETFEDDEIKTLFPDRATLRAYVTDKLKASRAQDLIEAEEDEAEPEDDFDLNGTEQMRIRERLARRKGQKVRKEKLLENQGARMLGEKPAPVPKLSDLLKEFETGTEPDAKA